MKRKALTALALVLTGALIAGYPALQKKTMAPEKGVRILRVWVVEKEKAVDGWLKKRAAAYEKERKQRIYLRSATEAEAEAALRGEEGIVGPDLLVMPGLEEKIALRGYGLIIKDEKAQVATSVPTGALFSRPTPASVATAPPPRRPSPDALGTILASEELSQALPNLKITRDPAADFAAGKGNGAVLTAGQAAQLPFGYQAYPLETGFLPVTAKGLTGEGEDFLSYLQSTESQYALAEAGLYSKDPDICLYGESQPLRALFEQGR